ncbi:hypothetical protein QQ045_010960 [Rhodiola kirilowii]
MKISLTFESETGAADQDAADDQCRIRNWSRVFKLLLLLGNLQFCVILLSSLSDRRYSSLDCPLRESRLRFCWERSRGGTLVRLAFCSLRLTSSSYLVTTLKVVPRGTEGAVSLEGTLAGLVAAALLAYVGCYLNLIKPPEAIVCIIASQIANVGESIIGATLQEKEGFQWLNNDLVNVINISMGSIIAVMIQQLLMGSNLKVIH